MTLQVNIVSLKHQKHPKLEKQPLLYNLYLQQMNYLRIIQKEGLASHGVVCYNVSWPPSSGSNSIRLEKRWTKQSTCTHRFTWYHCCGSRWGPEYGEMWLSTSSHCKTKRCSCALARVAYSLMCSCRGDADICQKEVTKKQSEEL